MATIIVPNHYEMLGLAPSASEDEIARAFARQMSLFKAWPMAAAAQMSIAYETLRNPTKRRAYDDSIGIRPPEPPRAPTAVKGELHFVPVAPAVERTTLEPAPAPVTTRREPQAEPRTAAFIAASLREPTPIPVPQADAAPVPDAVPLPEPRIPEFLEVRRSQPLVSDEVEARMPWRRPAVVMAALVGGVGLIGAWAGSTAGGDASQEQVTVAVPKAKAQPAATVVPPSPVEAEAERDTPLAFATLRTKRQRTAHHAVASVERPSQAQPLHHYYETTAADGTTEIAAAPATTAEAPAEAPATVTQASMPISNATIARTIGRIGYACGEVASTSAIDGEAGSYKVTCTSGHSYTAKPVRGRYHFRRVK